MTTITLKINEKTKAGKLLTAMIDLLCKNKSDVEIINTPNFETLKAMEDAKNGKVIKAKSAKELLSILKS
jgi:hypothetical protein